MPVLIQPSFSKGEVGPSLYGRVDTSAYSVAVRQARNCVVLTAGGLMNRAGLYFLAPCKTHGSGNAPYLIDFQFKTTDSYVLEFGNLYMRVIRNDAHVVEDPKTITGITNANPGVVTANAHGYVDGDEVYLADIVGMTRVNGKRFVVDVLTVNTFAIKDQITGANIDTTALGAYVSGGTASRIYTLVTPYAYADLERLNWVQNADVMTLTHKSYEPRELTRLDHDNWTLTVLDPGPSITFPRGESISVLTGGAATHKYRVTALKKDTLEESLPGLDSTTWNITAITKANPAVVTTNVNTLVDGDEVYLENILGMTELNGGRYTVNQLTTTTFEMTGVNSTAFTTYISGGTVNTTFSRTTAAAVAANNQISWTAVADAEQYAVYKFESGSYGFIGQTEATTFLDNNIAADLSISHPRAKDPFALPGQYPGCAGYFEQRRVFGGSEDKPDTSYFSQTGNQSNFNISSPQQDDDAITATLSAQMVNEIRHFISKNDLLSFTSGQEWRTNAGSDSAFSATTIRQKPQSSWGCSYIKPIVAGTTVLFVEENNARVRSFGYSFQLDGYTGASLTLLASHLFKGTPLIRWAYAPNPEPRVHAVRSDGKALCLSFDEEQDVIAWAPWDTRGKFKSVCTLRNPSGQAGTNTGVYFVVQRRINGNTVNFIEKLADRDFTNVRDCYFVDCGGTYNVPLTITNVALGATTVITSAAHGLSNGNFVDISDVVWESEYDDDLNETQPDQLNYQRFQVANVTTDTFEVLAIDDDGIYSSLDSSAYEAYVEGGYARKTVTVIQGFDQLKNMPVSVLADGSSEEGLSIDANGDLTLPRAASRVHVGLSYVSDIETLDIEANGGGTVQGRLKGIPSMAIRFEQSRGIFIGPNNTNLTELKERENEDYNEPTGLYTGVRRLTMPMLWNDNGRTFIRQKYPLPMTILGLIPDFVFADGMNE